MTLAIVPEVFPEFFAPPAGVAILIGHLSFIGKPNFSRYDRRVKQIIC